jgi:hypothetical protein
MASFGNELAVNMEMNPKEFELRCQYVIPVNLSWQVLEQDFGVVLPQILLDYGGARSRPCIED